jgi:membrane protein
VSVADGLKRRLAAARRRSRYFDHLIATFEHYSKVQGNVLAGAVTYFGFLSFFPILAIAFAVVGLITGAYPDAQDAIRDALAEVFPSIIGTGEGQIDPASFQNAAATAGVLGVVTLLYTGLGWLSTMRTALQDVFETPPSETHNFVIGKVVDLAMLAIIGFVLLISVGVSSATRGFVSDIQDWLNVDDVTAMSTFLNSLGTLFGLVASVVMFVVSFRLLGRPLVPADALWKGALLAAVGFEVLKQIAVYLIALTKDNPAFAVFGTALILLIWINYFSRLVLIGASWAATAVPVPSDLRATVGQTGTIAGAAAESDRGRPPRVGAAGSVAIAPPASPDQRAASDRRGVPDQRASSEQRAESGAVAGSDEQAGSRERAEAAAELVRSAAVLVGVTWLLRRMMRSED